MLEKFVYSKLMGALCDLIYGIQSTPCMHACALSWHLQLSPEDHHHHEIMISISSAEAHKPYKGGRSIYATILLLLIVDWLLDLTDLSKAQGPYMYRLPYVYAYTLSYMRRITLILMQAISISSYKPSFSYKPSNGGWNSQSRYICNKYIWSDRHKFRLAMASTYLSWVTSQSHYLRTISYQSRTAWILARSYFGLVVF
jgi:hypothetical protein